MTSRKEEPDTNRAENCSLIEGTEKESSLTVTKTDPGPDKAKAKMKKRKDDDDDIPKERVQSKC